MEWVKIKNNGVSTNPYCFVPQQPLGGFQLTNVMSFFLLQPRAISSNSFYYPRHFRTGRLFDSLHVEISERSGCNALLSVYALTVCIISVL